MILLSLKLGWLSHYKMVCQPVDDGPNSIEFAWKVCYTYFLINIIDLLDTVFFVLRKKQNQVTFLHVYHHFGMVAVAWGMVKWVPGGHMTFLVPINSFVHIIMYTYYFLTVWDESYKKSMWWKKHVTQIQISSRTLWYVVRHSHALSKVRRLKDDTLFIRIIDIFQLQFSILLLHFLMLVVANDCTFPRQPAYILIPQNLFMVILFSDFYYKTYVKSKKNNYVKSN
ncbi:unnamed protein product [Parnassius apollo]|uniref:Elongation of very long chain fatty acids protein n=1 Tax=Parnassius apollo TaxID=110799 RepID=A0A8S3VYT7_PARAO|nr:unnamed protein product [Parnassius apollo]